MDKLGAKIRSLRKEKNISQEVLAQALNISYQAVSKWENGAALPDITLIPPMAAYFGVTTDELLSFDRSAIDAEVKRIADQAFEYREKDPARSRSILEAGLARYPDNDVLMNNLLYTMDYTHEPDATIGLASRLAAKTADIEVRYDALRFLAYAYHAKGEEQAAVDALEQVPELYFTKLSEMAFVTTGQRKLEAAEKQKWISFETLIQMQWKLAECSEEAGDIPGAAACTRRAIRLIDALSDEEKITLFETYKQFFEKQLIRLEDK